MRILLAEVIKLYGVQVYKITPYNKCTVLKYTYSRWPYYKLAVRKGFQILVQNYQGRWVPNTTTLKY